MKRFSKITTTQLARICGVSQGTVDRALHGRRDINPQTRERILAVAREYDYVPSVQGTRQVNSMLIGVVLFDLYNAFFSRLAMEFVNAAKQFGYSILFQFSDKSIDNERAALEYFDYIGVDGIVLFSVGSDSEEYANYLHSLKKPLILIGNPMPNLPYVGIDDTRAMYDLTLRLNERSKEGEILYYAPVLKEALHATNAQRLRLKGFEAAMASIGRPYRVIKRMEELSSCGGIVCATDYHAVRVLEYLSYPDDIAIAGFDNTALLQMIRVPIWTVECQTDQIAQACVNYILGRPYVAEIAHQVVYHAR